jgi:DNA polymerase-1
VLYIVDFLGYVFRAYHAIAPLSSPRGEPTHATYGTVAMLSKLIAERKPAFLGVATDSRGARARTEMDPRYKAHRPPPPADLLVQIQRSEEFVRAYNIPTFSADGLEADDLIAALVARARALQVKVVIASSDKDLMQLVDDDRVLLWDTMRDKVYGTPEVVAKLGVPPSQVRDLLALVGDASDNVPGVPGIGSKTAAELLRQFGSMDQIYEHLEDVKARRTRETLQANRAEAELSRRLVTFQETSVDVTLESLRYRGPDEVRLRELFTDLGFTRLTRSLPSPPPAASEVDAICDVILDSDQLARFAEAARSDAKLAVGVLGTSPDAMSAHVYGLFCAVDGRSTAYIPVAHRYLGAPKQTTMAELRTVLGPVLADPRTPKVAHDAKYCDVLLSRYGVELRGVVMDTMLAGYLLDPDAATSLEHLAMRDAGREIRRDVKLSPSKRGGPQPMGDEVEVSIAAKDAARYAAAELALAKRYSSRLRAEKLESLLADIEIPLTHVLADMERTGALVDITVLASLGVEMTKELARLEAQAREMVGHDFNIGSPKQLETVLFDVLGLKPSKKTKTGRSTDAEVLEALSAEHELPAIALEHRTIAKLKGTYVDALPKLVNPSTGRIHTRWGQAVAATGRLSSQDPNLQNIPVRTPLGKLIRRAFVAPAGSVLVSADYSQIELRVLAHLSQDPVLLDAFRKGEDIHVRTAMEVFGVSASGVTDEMRQRSKAINFGVIYGMGEGALAKRLGISRGDAARFVDAYFSRYSGVAAFMTKTLADARRTEVVHTLFGRRRTLTDLRSTDHQRRAQAERIARNTLIQGTAADLLKIAMLRVANSVASPARMVLTVHDELVLEVPERAVAAASERVRDAMESAYTLDVPLLVSVRSGPTWADA